MNNGKIYLGIAVFILACLFPFFSGGNSSSAPKPEISAKAGEKCVESAEFMRANHMQILDEWRHDAVRAESNQYTSVAHGTTHLKSLSKTCMECHDNKEQFCDSCHTYANVKPYCWECHVTPKEGGI